MGYGGMKSIYLRRLFRLGEDDRGAVFWFGLVILFMALAVFSMTYDTSRFIEKKMIAQNAADAAALEMAVWQSRGLNMIQEINNDIYEIDAIIQTSVITLSGVLAALNTAIGASIVVPAAHQALKQFKKWGFIPICKALLTLLKTMRTVTVRGLKFVRKFYVYGANTMGYLGALEAAASNGASVFLGKDGTQVPKELQNSLNNAAPNLRMPSGIRFAAVGVPLAMKNPFALPVKEVREKKRSALRPNSSVGYRICLWHLRIFSFDKGVRKILNAKVQEGKKKVKWVSWTDEYYEGPYEKNQKTGKTGAKNRSGLYYPAWIWVTHAKVNAPLMSDTFLWRDSGMAKPEPYAYAVAQPRGGNIVRYVNEKGSRKLGYGAGVEASLIPVSEVKNWNPKFTAFLENLMFMH